MTKMLMIDPPSGWKYGFPKPMPMDQYDRAREWLLNNGYPEKEMESYGEAFYYRCWETDDHDESTDAKTSGFADWASDIKLSVAISILACILAEMFTKLTGISYDGLITGLFVGCALSSLFIIRARKSFG